MLKSCLCKFHGNSTSTSSSLFFGGGQIATLGIACEHAPIVAQLRQCRDAVLLAHPCLPIGYTLTASTKLHVCLASKALDAIGSRQLMVAIVIGGANLATHSTLGMEAVSIPCFISTASQYRNSQHEVFRIG
jgi:hypothetical protein